MVDIIIKISEGQTFNLEAYQLLAQAASLSSSILLGCKDYFQVPVYWGDKKLAQELADMGFMEKICDIPEDGKPYDLPTHKGVEAYSIYQCTENGRRFIKFMSPVIVHEKSYDNDERNSKNKEYPKGDWRRGHPGYE